MSVLTPAANIFFKVDISHVTLKYRIVRAGAERGALQTVLVDHQYTRKRQRTS